MAKISRPCYDKSHRCPGWAGPGWRYPKVGSCASGRLLGRDNPDDLYGDRLYAWRTHRCTTCTILVLPSAVRWLDPTWLRWKLGRLVKKMREVRR